MDKITTAYTLIEVCGKQALVFLQGQLTCDVLNLAEGQVQRGALCNLQGRVLALIDVCIWQQKTYLCIADDLVSIALQTLKKPASFSRVTLQPTETRLPEFSLAMHDPAAYHRQELEQRRVLIHASTSGIYLPHTLNLHQSNIINFNKGCYRGQEIIARMHYRGKLKYTLVFMTLTSQNKILPGEKITTGEVVDCCQIDEHLYLAAISQLITRPVAF
jgi:hypothetical protein